MEQLGILKKARPVLSSAGFDAVVVTGVDHASYLSGAHLPFARYRRSQALFVFWALSTEPVCVCPAEWETVVRGDSWISQIEPYDARCDDYRDALAVIQRLAANLVPGALIGIDLDQVSAGMFTALQAAMPGITWQDCSRQLRDLRMIKTAQEKQILELVAEMTDHGLNGAIHHVTVDRRTTALTLAEELRVHTEERGVDLVGYHAASHVAAGKETSNLWTNPPKYGYSLTDDLHAGEMVRMKVQTSLSGYWADATRIMIMGEPDSSQVKTYQQLVILREAALSAIKPGALCSQVFAGVRDAALKANIDLFPGAEVGHGIGVQPCEPPYLNPCDDTPLAEGMLLIIDPIVRDADGQIWRTKDTVVVTPTGCQLVGWYKDWREPYIPIASI